MKIQCACGTKVAFDVTPEMARTRVKFVCPNCGQDSSDFVNELIQREVAAGSAAPAMPPPVEIAPPPTATATAAPTESPAAPPARPRLTIPTPAAPRPIIQAPQADPAPVAAMPAPRPIIQASPSDVAPSAPMPAPRPIIQAPAEQPAAVPRPVAVAVSTKPRITAPEAVRAAETARPAASKYCSKHPGQLTTHACVMCHKLICPKCMQLFGYVCSPLCKEKAELQGIKLPIYAGQRDLVAHGEWRKVRLISTSITAAVILLLGIWIWYVWFATVPGPTFSLRFDRPSYTGHCKLVGDDQIIFLHGLTMARYDLKTKKPVWSFDILTREEITNIANIARIQMSKVRDRDVAQGGDSWNLPTPERMVSQIANGQAGELSLHVMGQNIWVSSFRKLTRYDFNTGKSTQSIRLSPFERVRPQGDEILMISMDPRAGTELVRHLDLASGQTQNEVFPIERDPDWEDTEGFRLPEQADSGDLDPEQIAARYSHMSFPEKQALPATLSVAKNQQAALKEMREQDQDRPRPAKKKKTIPVDSFRTILTKDGAIQFSERLLEEKYEEHVAMKAPPKKTIVDENLTVGNSMEASGEILNQMRRDAGGATTTEDVSRYKVIVRRTDTNGIPDWSGEVIGTPSLFPLDTVDVVAGGKSITVLDKQNKVLWHVDLTFRINEGIGFFGDEEDEGRSPCVEHGNTLYVYDQGVLTAFDLTTGNVRWRVPSVGIYDLHFTDDGMLYVSTTSANPDTLKYPNQIDLGANITDVLMKVDPKDGKTLWSVQPGGKVSYISGKYIYTLASYTPYEDDEHPWEKVTGFETPPYAQVKRIDPTNGKILWEHFEERGPLDVQFDKNRIEFVFKKEVLVLKYFTF